MRAARRRAEPARLVIADDHAGVRAALTRLLGSRDDMDVVGVARDGAEAVRMCRDADVDVVVMDLAMPRLGGVEATRRIRAEHPATRVVVLTSAGGDELGRARAAGAHSCVLKHEPGETLIDAILAALG